MKKKAQYTRGDLWTFYVASLVIITILVGTLYHFGFIGQGKEHGSLVETSLTAAAVTETKNHPETTSSIQKTDNASSNQQINPS